MTPQTTGQWVLWLFVWLTVYNAVHFGILTIFGRPSGAELWLTMFIATLTCIPFLSLAMAMLQLHQRLQAKLYNTSTTDLLTKIPNRRAFIDDVEEEMLLRGGIVMMIDIDHFKNINDTYGHEFGDICLRKMASHIKPVLLKSYYYGRLGGEEFAIMLFGGSEKTAQDIGAIVCSGIRIYAPNSRERLNVTCSVGGAIVSVGDSLTDVLSRADNALYLAKQSGRARMVMSDNTVSSDIRLLSKMAS